MLRNLHCYFICLALTARIFYTSFADPVTVIPVSVVPFPRRVSLMFPQQSQVCDRWKRCLCARAMSPSEQPARPVFVEQFCLCLLVVSSQGLLHPCSCRRGCIHLSKGSRWLVHRALIAWAAPHGEHSIINLSRFGSFLLGFWLQNGSLGNQDIFIWYLLYEVVFFPFYSVSVLRIIYMWK